MSKVSELLKRVRIREINLKKILRRKGQPEAAAAVEAIEAATQSVAEAAEEKAEEILLSEVARILTEEETRR